MWVLMNHYRDEQDQFENTKLLCRFINPTAAAKLFDQTTVEKTESTEDIFFEEMAKDLKGKYSPEELAAMLKNPEKYQEFTKIEKVD